MDRTEKKENWFVRALIVLFCLLLASMIGFSYFSVEPKGQINSGIITLLLLLLVLILSESFDNFSIGKLISITRESKKKEKEVQKLEKEKSELLNQLITISNSQHQTQQHTNVYGDYHAGKGASVERASEQEVEAKVSDERSRVSEVSGPEFRIDWRKVELVAMRKYVTQKGIHAANVITEAKLVTQFHGIDPISNYQPIFDGYYKYDDKEIFIEFRPNRGLHMMLRDRIYIMLSKLNHYKNVNGASVHLDFVWLNIPEEENNHRNSDRFMQDFEPAIASGLLRINEIEITKEEMDSCKREV
ncbi:hypothetical protein [Plesiomonas shigelloides]|uniref:hypothetical protein n=1 Tax=Plesiomonas shigelloides TaxID=703 RepID=UPI0021181931|nr:hypothetical protein [Plesiomonas shigelloides]MCQ8860077.1 hypothetical protein [Plesiomonas shigelloides]